MDFHSSASFNLKKKGMISLLQESGSSFTHKHNKFFNIHSRSFLLTFF